MLLAVAPIRFLCVLSHRRLDEERAYESGYGDLQMPRVP
jgi:hypothetical protein